MVRNKISVLGHNSRGEVISMDIAEGGKDGSRRPESHPQHPHSRRESTTTSCLLEKRKEKIITRIIEDLPMFAEKILSYTEVEFT